MGAQCYGNGLVAIEHYREIQEPFVTASFLAIPREF